MNDYSRGISPFSTQRQYKVNWRREELPHNKNVKLTDQQKETLHRLGVLKVGTKNQIALQLNFSQLRRGKDIVNHLTKHRFLIPHVITDEVNNYSIPFYSLAPDYAKKIGVEPIFEPMRSKDILKSLLLSQFFVRFQAIDQAVVAMPFPRPFDCALTILGSDYRVSIIRGDEQEILKHFMYHQEQMKTLFVVEDLSKANELKAITQPIRITTDYHLLNTDLSQSFYRLSKDSWEQVSIPVFKQMLKEKKRKELEEKPEETNLVTNSSQS